MKIKKALIDRGHMGRDRVVVNLNNLNILEDEVPVYLENENVDKEPLGTAKVYKDDENNWLWADIDLPSSKTYLKLYPSLALSIATPDTTSSYRNNIRTVNNALLIGVVLSKFRNTDNQIPILGRKVL